MDPFQIQEYVPGSTVLIEWKVLDNTQTPPQLSDVDSLQLRLYQPDGTIKLDFGDAVMSKVTDNPEYPEGLYRYLFDSDAADQPGLWRMIVKTSVGGRVNYSDKIDAFILSDPLT